MKHLSSLLIICLPLLSFAQDSTYSSYVGKSTEYYKAKNYTQAIQELNKAFAYLGGKAYPNERYNAACLWALAGNKDSAFYHLNKMVKGNQYGLYDVMLTDDDLSSLHKDKRWEEVCTALKLAKEKKENYSNKSIGKLLDSIFRDDQNGRMQLEKTEKQYGRNSEEIKKLWESINTKDSLDQIVVTRILDTYGWLGPDEVGSIGNNTLFLVIQHANIKIQEKYLPMMREAVKKGKAQGSALALLEDRVALREGKKQVYGSQIGRIPATGEYYVFPLEDPDNVDKRRQDVGLQPIADYLRNWNLKWDSDAYKKRLPELEAEAAKIKW